MAVKIVLCLLSAAITALAISVKKLYEAVEPLIYDHKIRRRRELWGDDTKTVESLQNSLSSMCGRAGTAERLAEHYRLRNVELSQKVIELEEYITKAGLKNCDIEEGNENGSGSGHKQSG